ncbi:hypothetical protein ACQFX9_00490 [Aliinostoc sp. HNIBRCY26]|uniref:hypothetical protein n=1 Tax=Aliinostoc sp. HNIBRCY26 TaxID=3418997 RepID=UPI003D065A49
MTVAVRSFTSILMMLGIISITSYAQAAITDEHYMLSQNAVASLPVNSASYVNSLAEEIAKLEGERALLLSRYLNNSPQVITINNKIQTLHQRYAKIGGNKVLLNQTLAKHLVNKIANLEVETALLYARYSEISPQIAVAELDVKNLRDRWSKVLESQSKIPLNNAVSQAIENKILTLKGELTQLQARYHQNSIEVVVVEEKIKMLQKRLAMYR